jgi:hypothetical protein
LGMTLSPCRRKSQRHSTTSSDRPGIDT